MSQNVFIVGATSAMAQELAVLYAESGAHLFLAGRSAPKLRALEARLQGSQAQFRTFEVDLLKTDGHEALIQAAFDFLGDLDTILFCQGVFGEPDTPQGLRELFEVNLLSVLSLSSRLISRLDKNRVCTLGFFSSIAGERSKARNLLYGTSKNALNFYLQGLRDELRGTAIRVVNLKVGNVISPMTADLPKKHLWATPRQVAPSLYKAIEEGRSVAFVPGYWALIMFVIRCLPMNIVRRLNS